MILAPGFIGPWDMFIYYGSVQEIRELHLHWEGIMKIEKTIFQPLQSIIMSLNRFVTFCFLSVDYPIAAA